MKQFLVFVIEIGMAALVPGLLLAQSSPAAGTWKLNLAKSKYSAAAPRPKSETRTVEAQGDGLKVSYDAVNADGSSTAYSYTANFDGKENPITGSGQASWRDDRVNGADTVALKRIDTNTYEGTFKKARKVVLTTRTTVSKDGKTTTLTARATDTEGHATTDVIVFEKK